FIIVLFFVLSIKDFKIANVAIYAFPDLATITRESKPFLLAIFCPALLLPFWEIALFGKAEPIVCLKGFFAGILPIALCLTDCLLLFGAPLAARLSYPLFSAVGTVTVGPLFTRMDGVIYYLLFSSALMKTTLSLKGSVWILRGWCGKT
ncbi:MAG: hypothetical protein IJT66_03715, partial [Clostridia bacterium]|nr:hypothetical protein [Clostridia bacterium]